MKWKLNLGGISLLRFNILPCIMYATIRIVKQFHKDLENVSSNLSNFFALYFLLLLFVCCTAIIFLEMAHHKFVIVNLVLSQLTFLYSVTKNQQLF